MKYDGVSGFPGVIGSPRNGPDFTAPHSSPRSDTASINAWSYWDNTNKRATKIATDNTLIGVSLGTVGSGADETTGRVRLNSSF